MKTNDSTFNGGRRTLLMLIILAFFITNGQAQTELFSTPGMAKSKAISNAKLDGAIQRSESKRNRQMSINRKAFEQKSMVLNMFDDAKFKVNFTEVRIGDTNEYEAREIWYGDIENKPLSHVEIYVYDDHVSGRVYTGDQLFTIDDLENDMVAVVEIDKKKMIPESAGIIVKK